MDSTPQPRSPLETSLTHGPIIPEISLLNLLDYGRVLRWILWQPATLTQYKAQYGNDSLTKIGVWLTTTLLWVPLSIPFIGYITNRVPITDTVATIFVLALPLSAWFVYTRSDIPGAVLGVLFTVIHTVDKTAADGNIRLAAAAEAALTAAFFLPLVIAVATTDAHWSMRVFMILSAAVGTWVALHVGGEGFVMGFLVGLLVGVFLLPLVLELSFYLKRRYQAGKSSLLVLMVVAVTLVGYSVLAWIYWLDGWQNLVGR